MKLEFSQAPSDELLEELERSFRDTGVESWPGSEFYVYADESPTTIYLVWQKGMAWLPIIIGLLGSIVLPPLLTAGIWLILPDSLKNLISTLMNMGMMMLVMWLMMSLMKPLTTPGEKKPKQIEEQTDERVSSRTI